MTGSTLTTIVDTNQACRETGHRCTVTMMNGNLNGRTGHPLASHMTVLLPVAEMTTHLIDASEGMKVAMAGMPLLSEGMITLEEDHRQDHLLHETAIVERTGMVVEMNVDMAAMIHIDRILALKEMVALAGMATGVAGMSLVFTMGEMSHQWALEEMSSLHHEAEWTLYQFHHHSDQRVISGSQMTVRSLCFTGRTEIMQRWWKDGSRTLACKWTYYS